ncbi:hypothetical protein ACIBG5_31795 [Kribbella sp. NPDC050241]|uniref:hypothetical protein n=1 Tax=Kribbella sp. NPDC050241 TaxID=3364115 RepID=UPI0037926BF5
MVELRRTARRGHGWSRIARTSQWLGPGHLATEATSLPLIVMARRSRRAGSPPAPTATNPTIAIFGNKSPPSDEQFPMIGALCDVGPAGDASPFDLEPSTLSTEQPSQWRFDG